jgi:general stress protein CsbA
MSWWPAVVFGWPAILLSILLAITGISSRRPAALFVSAVIAAPFSFYLAGTPRVGWLALMLPVLLIGAGIAVRYRSVPTAWLLLMPVVAVVIWVAGLVI